jgi:hypothetical protein
MASEATATVSYGIFTSSEKRVLASFQLCEIIFVGLVQLYYHPNFYAHDML